MKVVADANIPFLKQTFGHHAELLRSDGRQINRDQLNDADVLLVRSVTQVDAALLEGTPVKFVGSTTIGTDHLDNIWLDRAGITWASAPGCNADAAAQYTLAMMLLACKRLGKSPAGQSVGVIGHGNVGSRLTALLSVMGIASVACDPPLAAQGIGGLVSMDEALSQSVVSLHIPLTHDGPCPTWRMLGHEQLAAMPDASLLVNAARGEVVDGDALLGELESGRLYTALDVWPGEPEPLQRLVELTTVATPHVAGYSEDGKLRGLAMVYRDFCSHFGFQQAILPSLTEQSVLLAKSAQQPCLDFVADTLVEQCAVAADDHALRTAMTNTGGHRGAAFDALRSNYAPRREFSTTQIHGASECEVLFKRLGFAPARQKSQ